MFSTPKTRMEKYFRKNPDIKTIVILGSYGRKSAIHALGTVLSQDFVVTMGVNKKLHPDIVILDYKSMAEFPEIEPDLAVITSIASDEEAKAFFNLANKAKRIMLNFVDVPQEYAKYLMNPNIMTYGDELPANFYFENHDFTTEGYVGDLVDDEGDRIGVKLQVLGEHNIRPITMSAAVAKLFMVQRQHILDGVESIHTLNGRMQPCKGLNDSLIIDDSADIGETSVYYGLRAIYAMDAPSRIVVTDNLAKMGKFDEAHIDEVVILGPKVEHNIKGAKINFFDTEIELVNYLGKHFEPKGIILLEIPLPQIIEGRLWD